MDTDVTPEYHLARAAEILRGQVPAVTKEEISAKADVLHHIREATLLISRLRDAIAKTT